MVAEHRSGRLCDGTWWRSSIPLTEGGREKNWTGRESSEESEVVKSSEAGSIISCLWTRRRNWRLGAAPLDAGVLYTKSATSYTMASQVGAGRIQVNCYLLCKYQRGVLSWDTSSPRPFPTACLQNDDCDLPLGRADHAGSDWFGRPHVELGGSCVHLSVLVQLSPSLKHSVALPNGEETRDTRLSNPAPAP